MRNRYSSAKQELGQFLTPAPIANLLASLLPPGGESILELGAGAGALLEAVSSRMPHLDVTAVEKDVALKRELRARGLASLLIGGDATSPKTIRRLAERAPFDYIVGNPPYAMGVSRKASIKLLEQYGLYNAQRGVRLDTYFLAQSISMMATTGAGAFILPMPLFSDGSYATFRQALLQRFSNITIVELPIDTFGNAEVSTAICSFSGLEGRRKRVKVARANSQGQIEDSIEIAMRQAVERMDFSFHKERLHLDALIGDATHNLRGLGAQVVRGSATSSELKEVGIQYLHTSDLPTSGIGELVYNRSAENRYQNAGEGDIVVPRVGTRCLFRQAVVLKGEVPFTESVFRIRVDPKVRDAVLNSLAGPIGQSWRRLHARGACAKHITATDLFDLPISI
jgi:phospholipid N-methyltransferase